MVEERGSESAGGGGCWFGEYCWFGLDFDRWCGLDSAGVDCWSGKNSPNVALYFEGRVLNAMEMGSESLSLS